MVMSVQCSICEKDGAEQKSGSIYFCPSCDKLFKALPHTLGIEEPLDITDENIQLLKDMLKGPKAGQTAELLKSVLGTSGVIDSLTHLM